jgi:hypothetical protein
MASAVGVLAVIMFLVQMFGIASVASAIGLYCALVSLGWLPVLSGPYAVASEADPASSPGN